MARALVTGATGFIGYHVAKALREKGFSVRALVRNGSDTAFLASLDVELAIGDVRDYGAVLKAIKGCDQVYHVAADYRLWVPDPETMYAINVQGTVNVMQGAMEGDVAKVVYTSTVGILAPAAGREQLSDEIPARFQDLAGHYKRSKFLAEEEVQKFIARGLPVVIVRPTAPIGAMDRKPTPTGKIIVDFLNGRMPAYLDTGLNFVDVKDVAEAHVLASGLGVVGESYILGNENITLKQFLHLLARLTGEKPPRWKLPYIPVLCIAFIDQAFSKLCGRKTPAIPLDGVRMARHYMFFDCSKAVQKLGMAQSPVEKAAQSAIEWFRRSGYAPPRSSGDVHG
ncbi:MAG: NAD-dependent epimerase/dehydratase family protein [Syntrophorhabdaceae bacterium]|nr:NAD-dependent epimerase/dehydratase family protein [Syntrophorhabdaceae bacterium]